MYGTTGDTYGCLRKHVEGALLVAELRCQGLHCVRLEQSDFGGGVDGCIGQPAVENGQSGVFLVDSAGWSKQRSYSQRQ